MSKISQYFPTICGFPPNARKINSWVVNFFEKYAKMMHFCNFLKTFFANFRKFSGVLGAPPPYPRPAITLTPKFFLPTPKRKRKRKEEEKTQNKIFIFPGLGDKSTFSKIFGGLGGSLCMHPCSIPQYRHIDKQ